MVHTKHSTRYTLVWKEAIQSPDFYNNSLPFGLLLVLTSTDPFADIHRVSALGIVKNCSVGVLDDCYWMWWRDLIVELGCEQ